MATESDLAALFEQPNWDEGTLNGIRRAAFAGGDTADRFRGLLTQLENSGGGADGGLKVGIAYALVGQYKQAGEWLNKAKPGAARDFYLGKTLRELGHYADAASAFERAANAGYDAVTAAAERAETMLLMGNGDGALELLNKHRQAGTGNPVWQTVMGRVYEYGGDIEAARASYMEAMKLDPDDGRSRFRLAFLCDLHGDDVEAIELYEQCSELPVVQVNALMNLAVVYEDVDEFEAARECLQRVLAVEPDHARARMFLADVEASLDMVIDENEEREAHRRSAVLDIPITEFELSVRARNCLKKMNIRTLGDLLRINESELLSYKNFGETSLNEIKAMLTQKGLRLGQFAEPAPARPRHDPSHPAVAGNPEVLNRPVAELELSVRSRKCLQRLNIATIGELCMRTEQELLSTRNFGQTSLNELKRRLVEMGLRLRKPGE